MSARGTGNPANPRQLGTRTIWHKDPRHEKFAQLVAGGMKLRDAYVRAGYTTDNPNSQRTCASRLARMLRKRIDEIIGVGVLPGTEGSREITETTAATIRAFQADLPLLRDKLWEIINNKDESGSTRVGAIRECLNRALGMPAQYTETNLNVRYQISDRELTEEEWDAKFCAPITIEHTGTKQ